MTSKLVITPLVESLLASGTAHDIIVRAVAAAERGSTRQQNGLATTMSPMQRGTRLPDDWRPTEADISYAIDLGMTLERIEHEAAKFSNYWTAKSGNGATKRNWHKTWRNWCLTAMENRNGFAGKNNRTNSAARPPSTGANAVVAGLGRVAARIDQRRASARRSDRQAQDNTNPPQQLAFDGGGT